MLKTQTKKITAFLSVAAMLFSMLLYFPGGMFSTYSGLKASAEGEEGVTFTATVGTAGAAADGSEGYASLIDGKYSSTDTSDYSKWCVTNFSSAYIIFSASEPILVTGYSIVTGNDNKTCTGRNPKSWTLYGCNDASANSEEGKDSTSWKVIDAVTDDEQLEDENYTEYVYDELTGSTSTKYQYFKLEITATQGSDVMQMSEFTLTDCVHDWEISDTIAPTCTKGGYDVYKCSVCNWQKKVPTAEAWGHDLGEDGFCTRCGVADTTPKEPSVVNNVYQIGTAGELYWFAYKVNNDNSNFGSARAVLTKDITVNSNLLGSLTFDAYGNVSNGTRFTSWTPICNSISNAYSGTFDGQNHIISGLYFNDSTVNDVSLFGYNNGTVKNVSVVDSYFKGYKNVGGVCGFNDGTITSCYNTGTVSGTSCVGGVCGWNATKCTITSCYNTGAVNGTSNVGGVCGFNDGTITSCYNTGTVSGTETIGGVCGYNYEYSTITNCYNTGAVSGNKNVGGVCGYNFTDRITNCYNTGTVSGSDRVGGVCGFNTCIIANCYYDSDKYSGNAIGADQGGTVTDVEGKTTAQFNRGEVAYRLSQGCTVDSKNITDDGSVWGQDLSTDNYPVLGGAKVYATTGCVTYNNDSNTAAKEHNYTFTADEHSCIDCGLTENHNFGEDNICPVCNTYAISTADQLYEFADKVNNEYEQYRNVNAVLTADITVNTGVLKSDGSLADDASGFRSWTPIGFNSSSIYTGTFDGQGHTVSGLYFNESSTSFVGLFGSVATSGSVSNVGVVDSYFNGNNNVGGVCGYSNGKITNCYNKGTVSGSNYVGGVCGEANYDRKSVIANCYNIGIIKGKSNTACVVGFSGTGKVSNCYYYGEKTEDDDNPPLVTQPVYPVEPITTSTAISFVPINPFITTTTGLKLTRISVSTTVTTTENNTSDTTSETSSSTQSPENNISITVSVTSSSTQSSSDTSEATGDEHATCKTAEQFASGEVAYLLNGSTSEGTLAWGQTIGTEKYPVLGGAKVYTANNNCTGYSNTENDTRAHNYVNGICQWCGDIENDIMIYGQSVTLDGTIGMNVYVAADDDYTNWTASFNDTVVEKPAKDENGLYKFTYQVAAKDMAKNITFSLSNVDSVTVSVKNYLNELDTSESTELAALVTAMETYGTAASEFFKTDGTVPVPAEEVTTENLSGYAFTKKETFPVGISYYGSSLILESETTIRHYFKLDAGTNIDEFTFTIDGNTVIPGEKSGYYYIDVKNISADKLGTAYTVKIGNDVVISNYSALSYAKTVINNDTADDNLKNLVKALYLYNRAAVGYNVKTGWVQDGENWYYYDDNGIMQTGWVTNIPGYDGAWFYFGDDGIMQTSRWVQDRGNWYYLDDYGIMQTGWVKDGENWYYLNNDGTLLTNGYTPDGYYVDENGIWIPGK